MNCGYLADSKGLPCSGKIHDMKKQNKLPIHIISVTSYKTEDKQNLKHCA